MERLTNLIWLFFLYSFAGWCMEVMLKYIQYHRLINRGFLTGPVCPIYGSGAVLITVVAEGVMPFESAYGTSFIISFVLCGAVEYLTSYFMEKRFHARWWDYSQKPMNLHGRVWIGNLLLFGAAGVGIIHGINPVLYTLLDRVSLTGREIAAGVMLALFAVDYAGTHFILKLVKSGVEKSRADNTEEIRQEIHALLSDRNLFYRRFADAYPDVIYRTKRVSERLEEVKAEAERIRLEAEARLQETREQVVSRMEPGISVRNGIIRRQDALIDLLYDENTASDEMKALKKEIEKDKNRLDSRPVERIAKKIGSS